MKCQNDLISRNSRKKTSNYENNENQILMNNICTSKTKFINPKYCNTKEVLNL